MQMQLYGGHTPPLSMLEIYPARSMAISPLTLQIWKIITAAIYSNYCDAPSQIEHIRASYTVELSIGRGSVHMPGANTEGDSRHSHGVFRLLRLALRLVIASEAVAIMKSNAGLPTTTKRSFLEPTDTTSNR